MWGCHIAYDVVEAEAVVCAEGKMCGAAIARRHRSAGV
jgi:hypothetical protein